MTENQRPPFVWKRNPEENPTHFSVHGVVREGKAPKVVLNLGSAQGSHTYELSIVSAAKLCAAISSIARPRDESRAFLWHVVETPIEAKIMGQNEIALRSEYVLTLELDPNACDIPLESEKAYVVSLVAILRGSSAASKPAPGQRYTEDVVATRGEDGAFRYDAPPIPEGRAAFVDLAPGYAVWPDGDSCEGGDGWFY